MSYTEPMKNVLSYPLWIQAKDGSLKPLEIEQSRVTPQELIVKLKDINTPEQARYLTNQAIYTTREHMPDTDDDEVYWVDLMGCTAYVNDQAIGKVIDVFDTGSNDVLVIKNEQQEYLVPYTKEAVGNVDPKTKQLELLRHPEDTL